MIVSVLGGHETRTRTREVERGREMSGIEARTDTMREARRQMIAGTDIVTEARTQTTARTSRKTTRG